MGITLYLGILIFLLDVDLYGNGEILGMFCIHFINIQLT